MSNQFNPQQPFNPQPQPQFVPPQPPKKKHTGRNIVLTIVGVIAAFAIIGNLGGSSEPDTAAPADVTTTAPAQPEPKEEAEPAAEKEAPKAEPSEPAAEPEPDITMEQKQALRKAESYLEYTAFSKSGLREQLEYEGFDTADAKWAVNHVEVDWNEQAVLKARSYLEYSSFSEQELAGQLEYEGFTPKQAAHGASVAYSE